MVKKIKTRHRRKRRDELICFIWHSYLEHAVDEISKEIVNQVKCNNQDNINHLTEIGLHEFLANQVYVTDFYILSRVNSGNGLLKYIQSNISDIADTVGLQNVAKQLKDKYKQLDDIMYLSQSDLKLLKNAK